MIDATPSATPMPAHPLATVASTEAPFPPADPLSVFVPQSVTDPISNLDFLPVDDAFALEMRSETIEQLVGGDALRRGVSERIEAGRSQTNADLVAGRNRVRVHGTLHEHTGHALAEQGAHLHTTVDGTLDVHAASEDTVLLAGHMSDLWDGGRRHRRGDDRRHRGGRRHPGDDAARPVGARTDGGGGAHRDVYRRCGADGARARRTTSASTVPGCMWRGSRCTPARSTSRTAARSGP